MLVGAMRLLLCALLLAASPILAERSVDKNIIYGMHSGLALLMDIYHPAESNGYGIVVIPGSGWHAPLEYSAQPLKESREFVAQVSKLTGAGYTMFVITHRAAPRFHYPDAVEDAQRAVRFVRLYADQAGIDPQRLGALGGSSGGHLVSMLGVLDGKGNPDDPDPVERESAKVQTVVALYAPADMSKVNTPFGSVTVTAFLGMRPPREQEKHTLAGRIYTEASPMFHVTADDPPFLLIHGDADKVVPYQQSKMMEAALSKAGVPVKLIVVPGGGHGSSFPGARAPAEWTFEAQQWFDAHLKSK